MLALLLAAAMLFPLKNVVAESWYRSNAAAMTLEPLYSRFIALHEAYCLSVASMDSAALPALLRSYYDAAFRIELHTLYENGKESRQQWIFKDERGTTRLVSAFDKTSVASVEATNTEAEDVEDEGDVPDTTEEKNLPEFIEIYNEDYLITEEREFIEDGSETVKNYFYNGKALIRVESGVKADGGELRPVTTDYYRYTRAQSLRAVDRVYHAVETTKVSDTTGGGTTVVAGAGEKVSDTIGEGTTVAGAGEKVSDTTGGGTTVVAGAGEKVSDTTGGETTVVGTGEKVSDTTSVAAVPPSVRLQFPRPGATPDISFITPNSLYTSTALPSGVPATKDSGGEKVVYTTDTRGRILTETRQDENGAVLSEMHQTWDKDRVSSIVWKSGKTERRTEFDYNADGDRVMERDYNNGVLERTMRQDEAREIEELYLNGVVVLRAIWENGRKISEERVR